MQFVQQDTIGGNDANTRLLLHMDGANGSTSFLDSSVAARSVTANGSAQVSTAQGKFSGCSGAFLNGGNCLTIADNTDWPKGTSDWSIDFWSYHTSVPVGGNIDSIFVVFFFQDSPVAPEGGVDQTIGYLNAAGGVSFRSQAANPVFPFGSTQLAYYKSNNLSLAINTWHHWEFTRSGTNFFIFLNGVSVAPTVVTAIGSNSLPDCSNVFRIGAENPVFVGPAYMDEFRLSNIARHVATFLPPNQPYG